MIEILSLVKQSLPWNGALKRESFDIIFFAQFSNLHILTKLFIDSVRLILNTSKSSNFLKNKDRIISRPCSFVLLSYINILIATRKCWPIMATIVKTWDWNNSMYTYLFWWKESTLYCLISPLFHCENWQFFSMI